jgi:AraC-like DNA-binding protein
MLYQKYNPCSELLPFVECYFIWQSEQDVNSLTVESPASGFCSIIFNCGDDYYIQNKKYDRMTVPKQFIAGQSIYSYKLSLEGNISVAGIVLKPAALASIFKLPTYEYTEERIKLDTVLNKQFVEVTASEIEKTRDPVNQVRLLEKFVLIFYRKNTPVPDQIDLAANTILEKNGMVHINDLIKNAFMSRRNFERRFFKKVGLSPKYYARIRRMAYIMNLIAGKKNVDWKRILSECEFYDQSHFIKDFIEFTGRSPEEYLKENSELANLIEKPKTMTIK